MTTADGPIDVPGDKPARKKSKLNLGPLQKFGRALMLPIAVLPIAGLLVRLGQPDMLGEDRLGWNRTAAVIAAAGDSLLTQYLPLLFAIGIAIGLARKADGSTALAAAVGWVVFDAVGEAMTPFVLDPPAAGEEQLPVNYGVFGGIVMGLITAFLWQRYHRIKLPPYLAFFGGRRFVPMITALSAIIVSVLMSFVYQYFDMGITAIGEWVANNEILGGFVYGTLNRLLIPTGLHHILNNPPWFLIGEYTPQGGDPVRGDIARFLNGDPSAGTFMTGFFPIMMFALPAAALAIIHEAKPAQKKLVGGIMGSTALTAFLTGVTEPLEFAFMFVAWPLYIIHALLTGSSLALTNWLGIRDGFNFSAGLFDYVINFGRATDPLLLIPIGLGYALVYYVLFRVVIRWWNLKTPGREDEDEESIVAVDDSA